MDSKDKRALIVDDDPNICELLRLYFMKEGFKVRTILDGNDALAAFADFDPTLVVLDLMLPGKDGYDICREIRKTSQVPIIMLTARGETLDKVVGLELGADDYLTKPFEPSELMARVKAILRRSETIASEDDKSQRVVYPGLVVDLDSYVCEINGQTVEMPPKELELLFFLAASPNHVYTREQLLGSVWGYDFYGESRTVDVHVKRIREKIALAGGSGQWEIKTVWGVGYKFATVEEDDPSEDAPENEANDDPAIDS